jgi:hypothetical protein
MPARSISFWLVTSASEGASLRVEMKNRLASMLDPVIAVEQDVNSSSLQRFG